MPNQQKSMLTRIFEWIISFFSGKRVNPLGGPTATSATVRVTRPEKGFLTIIKLTAYFDNSVNSPDYLNGAGNIVLTNSSFQSNPQATFKELQIGTEDTILTSTVITGSLGDVLDQNYKMQLNLNGADPASDSETQNVEVTITS